MCATAAERAEWEVGENSPAGTKVRVPWSSLQPSSLGGPVTGGSAGRAAAHWMPTWDQLGDHQCPMGVARPWSRKWVGEGGFSFSSVCVCQQKTINEINFAYAECTLAVLISTHKVFSTHFPPSLLSRNEKAAWWSLATNIHVKPPQRIEQLVLQVQLSHGCVNVVVHTWPKCIGSHAGSQI